MDIKEAQQRLEKLIIRDGGSGPHLIGILIVDSDGSVGVSMDTDNETDITMIGVRAHRKAGPVVVERELASVTPTLETIR